MDCMNKNNVSPLRVVFGDVTLGVHGEGFDYIFSYVCGGLESLMMEGKEWLYRAPKPTFWRAVTDNDRGNGFSLRSAMWLGADMFIKCTGVGVRINDSEITLPIAPQNNLYGVEDRANRVRIVFTYETTTIPATTVIVAYEVFSEGQIRTDVYYHGKEGLPQLPVFGMRFIMPGIADSYKYEGLSGETYPDRMAGGIPGVYHVDGLPITHYMVPQDCQMHMATKWLEIYKGKGIRFSSTGHDFAFSCIPYTAEELENASHMEELPLARRTVVSILGAVRGVGGINSWGADVEPAYHIDAQRDIRYSFLIEKAASK